MFLPETYQAALFLMLLSMLCWGSWANTLKLCPRFRFQLFYWDYAIGLMVGAVVLGLTAGSIGKTGLSFLADIVQSPLRAALWAAGGGVVFNVANLLLVAAIDVAGLAVAFPVGIGLALIVGSVSSYLVSPAANPLLLFGGVALVAVAIVTDAAAYRKREASAKATTTRGIVLSLIAGLLMGSFYPLVAHAMKGTEGVQAPGPYAISFFFAIGVLLSTVPANLLLMAKPLDGKPPVAGGDYWRASLRLARSGYAWRGHLVYGSRGKLCGFRRTPGGAGGLLLNWAGSHDGVGMLGGLCVARIRRRSAIGTAAAGDDVYLFRPGAWGCGAGSALLRID